jgi:hypothetical protein
MDPVPGMNFSKSFRTHNISYQCIQISKLSVETFLHPNILQEKIELKIMFQIVQFEGGEGPDVPVLEVDREGRHLSRLRIQVSLQKS